MYLLYVDESGLPKRGSAYYVLAGLAVHEENAYPLARSLDRIQRSCVNPPDDELELHASHIWAGRKEWSHIDGASRRRLMTEVLGCLGSWKSTHGRSPIFFAIALHKRSFLGRQAPQLAHEHLLRRFDLFLSRLHQQGESHRSLVICDESSHEKVIQSSALKWKLGGDPGRLNGLVEVPLYVDSRSSRLVQAVDFVAWATYQYYEFGHEQWLNLVHDRFDASDGVQHGVTHLVRGHVHCSCVACTSRRQRLVADKVTGRLPMLTRERDL